MSAGALLRSQDESNDLTPSRRQRSQDNWRHRQEHVTAQIRALAGDSSVAPLSTANPTVSREAARVYGSYPAACHAAGVLAPSDLRIKHKEAANREALALFHGVAPPLGCEEAKRLGGMAIAFCLRHNIGGSGSGLDVLHVMRLMYEIGM